MSVPGQSLENVLDSECTLLDIQEPDQRRAAIALLSVHKDCVDSSWLEQKILAVRTNNLHLFYECKYRQTQGAFANFEGPQTGEIALTSAACTAVGAFRLAQTGRSTCADTLSSKATAAGSSKTGRTTSSTFATATTGSATSQSTRSVSSPTGGTTARTAPRNV